MAKLPTEIKSLARVHTATALKVLAKIMTEETAPHAARVAAAHCLLDRGWGKAAQAVEVSGEILSKVIRAPAMSVAPTDWAKEHVPQGHTEH